MNIEPKARRQRVYAVVTPETMTWLKEQKDKHRVSYGVLLDNLVREQKNARS